QRTAGGTFSEIYDGSGTGTRWNGVNIDALYVMPDATTSDSDNHLLMSFANTIAAGTLTGVSGGVGLADIIEFNPGAGSFARYATSLSSALVSADPNANIDALSVLGNGDVVFSTGAAITLGGVAFDNTDLIRWDHTANTFTKYFDGSDHSLTNASENIDAAS